MYGSSTIPMWGDRLASILLHFENCSHWYTEKERRAENPADPELRPATAAELDRRYDDHGRVWRKSRDCARRASS